MAKFNSIFFILIFPVQLFSKHYKYAVIGAGPAGIITVTQLLEQNISKSDILWLDSEFKVGRLGKYYQNVPSNQKAQRYTVFLNSCETYKKLNYSSFDVIKKFNQQEEPPLSLIVQFLQDITDYLRARVKSISDNILNIERAVPFWKINGASSHYLASKVILATGCHPKTLDLLIPTIPLDDAIDEKKLRKIVNTKDRVLVIGSAHSALLIMKYLSDLKVAKIINLYTKSPTYGMYGGLEGITAWWTKEILEKNKPQNIDRYVYSAEEAKKQAQNCTKVIYAFGYEKTSVPVNTTEELIFNPLTNSLAENLYGIGFAFPDLYTIEEEKKIKLIGVNSFMMAAKRLISHIK